MSFGLPCLISLYKFDGMIALYLIYDCNLPQYLNYLENFTNVKAISYVASPTFPPIRYKKMYSIFTTYNMQQLNRQIKIITYLFVAILIFGILTWVSYENGMAYDGQTSMGFPLIFYKMGVGQSLETGEMEQFTNFDLMSLVVDLLSSALIFLSLYFLFNMLLRNKRMF